MDSFYDAPRRPPMFRSPAVPLPSNANILPTHVPDVSMLEQNYGTVPIDKKVEMSYNAWKIQNQFGKENVQRVAAPQSQASILRKQVRFLSPQVQAPFRPMLPMENSTQPQVKENTFQAPIYNAPRSTNNILPAKPFQKVYLSNIPNRNLDLSIIESSRVEKIPISNGFQRRFHVAESTTIEPRVEQQPPQEKASDEPTVKDLMKIIQQQNEQLICLQKQVSTLLQERNEKPAMTPPQPIQLKTIDPNKGVLPKFAFDVMTSFEVSLKPPPSNKNCYQGPKIQEIFEPVNVPIQPYRSTDLSLTLNEPIVVQEECHSPEQSIHVEMQDFSSESEDDEVPSKNSLIGWTIYNNVMDQVNHLLKNSPEQKHNHQVLGGNTMKQVKQTTLRHLKSVGVNLPNNVPIDDSNDYSSEYSPNEISFAVKQLLMKYLPDEQLAKVNSNKGKQPLSKTKPNYPTNLINRRPEFSMATVQYMEKYNLLNKDKQSNKQQDNFLDMTALKQQPKLL